MTQAARHSKTHGWSFVISWLILASSPAAASGLIQGARISADETGSEISIRFNCKVAYQYHEPGRDTDRVRVYLEPTNICNGVSPTVAQSRSRIRPSNSDLARLVDLEYDGDSGAGPLLTLNFSESVTYTVDARALSFELSIFVRPVETGTPAVPQDKNVLHRQVPRGREVEVKDFVVNIATFRKMPTVADLSPIELVGAHEIFYSEVEIGNETWYRLKIGPFSSAESAKKALSSVQSTYPNAWIDTFDPDAVSVDLTLADRAPETFEPGEAGDGDPETADLPGDSAISAAGADGSGSSKADQLMDEARRTLIAGDRSRAIQLYTKILQLPENPRQQEAQEYLAVAREKNGQLAHAKAEYQRYLSLYPDGEGAPRVRQRLAAIIAGDRRASGANADALASTSARRRQSGSWRFQTFISQYYRRDVNQQNDQEEIVSQSALYSDVNFDARRRGERFDINGRISAGYRNDLLGEESTTGDRSRLSYAYLDVADAVSGLRARIGRQSRNTGGVLGRFDGLNIGYRLNERLLLSSVYGMPAYSASDGVDSERTFYGVSVDYGPIFDGLNLGLFAIHQDIEGIEDRQAVGTELRYFGSNQSVWAQIDYDTSYGKISSAFLQASWRIASRLSVHGSIDRRHSPFLSARNALIGQPIATFSELTRIFSEDEIRQLGLDRSPESTSYSMGLSYTLSPRFQINADANQTRVDATPASGGVLETPATNYRYFSTNLVAGSIFKEGDVTILGLRHSDSDTAQVLTMTLDSRFPLGRSWRVNPRIRVDRRDRMTDSDYEWIYTPGIRIQFRRGQKLRFELEAGKQFTERETVNLNMDRESYFLNFGYQVYF